MLKIYSSFLRTKAGKKYMKRLLLNPTYNKEELERRHSTIGWMARHMGDKKYFLKLFNSMHSVDSILWRFQRSQI